MHASPTAKFQVLGALIAAVTWWAENKSERTGYTHKQLFFKRLAVRVAAGAITSLMNCTTCIRRLTFDMSGSRRRRGLGPE